MEIGTYTSDKIKVIGSCTLLVVHPYIQCLKEVTFHVTSHEGSVVLSCATTLDLCLIQPSSNLDSILYSACLITSKADDPRKKKSQKICYYQSQRNVCSSKEQSPKLLPAQGYSVHQCVIQEDKEETSKQECPDNVISMEDDKNSQSNNCVNMWSVTKTSYMGLAKPVMKQSNCKKKNQMKRQSVCDDKNCQSTKSAKSVLYSDKNSQDTKCIHMQPVKPAIQSSNMTKPSHMQLPTPAMKQSNPIRVIKMTRTVNLPRNIVMKSVQ